MGIFTASDGARIAFADSGAARPLVLLHGLMGDSGFFAGQAPLGDRFRLVAIDLRGHGASTRGSGATVEAMAADVAEIADSLDLTDAIGVGWSLGATVLWHVLNGRASARFAGAVVIDMTPRVRNGDDWSLGLSPETCDARTDAIRTDYPAFATAAGQAIFADPATARAARAGAAFAAADPKAIDDAWQSLLAQDMRPALAAIRQPTLIVHGAQSHLYGADTADYLAEALPNARAIRFDGSGHSPHVEQPDLFNRILTDFAASLPRHQPNIANA